MSEIPLIWASLALHRHVKPLWNQDDPGIESLGFSLGEMPNFSPGHTTARGEGEVHVQDNCLQAVCIANNAFTSFQHYEELARRVTEQRDKAEAERARQLRR